VEHGCVPSVCGDQFIVGAVLAQASLGEDADGVGVADTGPAVGDQVHRPVRPGELTDAVEGIDLCFGVEVCP
jgi:hypothetical protein